MVKPHSSSFVPLSLFIGLLTFDGTLADPASQLPRSVMVATAPDRPWVMKKTRTLADLPPTPPDPPASPFGGAPKPTERATGFFRASKSGDRWWPVDPGGQLYINRGVSSVRRIRANGCRVEKQP